MNRKKADKKYIYDRDKGVCFFCNKNLKFRQISLDHYLPRSKGGPDDVFNLVLSCKKCNKLKKSYLPEDYRDIMIMMFKKGVRDGKIRGAVLKLKQRELEEITNEVYRVEDIGEYTVFQSEDYRFYIKENKVYKVVYVDTNIKEEEWYE